MQTDTAFQHARARLAAALLLAVFDAPGAVLTNSPTSASSPDLKDLTLEELLRIEVTTAARKPQPVSEAASAVHVITQEDIRRSGVTSIPEALRLAPGVQVARLDSHNWAISARGFNDIFANKLLVLQDGRSLYTPLFSGVFWDMQETLLEDIDRIEVVRGPGATLWGANAVNGVINIITRSAKDSQGWLVSGGAGTEERGFGAARYGGRIGEKAFFRVYGKYFDRDDSVFLNGDQAHDAWQMARGGFRIDWEPDAPNILSLEGDLYTGRLLQIYTVPSPLGITQMRDDNHIRGGHVLGKWSHAFSDDSDLRLQTYYERNERNTAIFKETRDTGDIDFQHRFSLGQRNELLWGGGYRVSYDDIPESRLIRFRPSQRAINLISSFIQDEITIVPERLRIAVGSKFEHNDYTGFEVQPSGRLVWTPTERQTVWAAIARAVRTPSRAEEDIVLQQPVSGGLVATLRGSNRFGSEELLGYELGYRVQPHARASLDLAAFYNNYDDLRTLEPVGPLEFEARNRLEGETYGVEIVPSVQVLEWWRVTGGYSYLQIQLHRKSNSAGLLAEADEGKSPHHQVFLRSAMDFPGRVELDAMVRYVDHLPALDVPSYIVLDTRLGWRAWRGLELAVVGQNLLDGKHQEFAPSFILTQLTQVEHSVYGKITWRF